MISKYFTMILIFLFQTYFSQNLDSLRILVEQNNSRIDKLKSEINSVESKFQKYIIYGEIRDREENYISIWGTAIPVNNDFSSVGTVEQGNIIVLKPDANNIVYNIYSEAIHYFLYKGSGKNYFGTDVPVRFYGDMPEQSQIQITSLLEQIINLQKENKTYEDQIENSILSRYFAKAKRLYIDQDFQQSMKVLKEAKQVIDDSYEIDTLLINNYIKLIESNLSNKLYIEALDLIDEGLSLAKTRKIFEEKFTDYKSIVNKKIALEYYDKANYEKAIQYFLNLDLKSENDSQNLKKLFAQAYFKIGRNELVNGTLGNAKSNFESAIKLDQDLQSSILEELSSKKKSPFLYGFYSLVPGVGQLAQGFNKDGYTQLALFVLSIGGAVYYKIDADDVYSTYQTALSKSQAENLYDEANKKLAISYGLFGLAAGIIVYSIVDSINKVNEYNKKFDLKIETKTYSSFQAPNDFRLSLKLFF